MADLKDRVSSAIYHELQEPDSSLCAQHCLNSLLQDTIFSAADLAELGRELDAREDAARAEGEPGGRRGSASGSGRRRQASPPALGRDSSERFLNADRSRNMDDSGFFSSQVMDEALKSFDLQLVRWRSERCKDLQAIPETQEAFVFNLSSHWFVIRRFGHSKHFFFDLNSFHPSPKHVSPLYLGLQIDQAEHEGYSVFVVLSTAPSSEPDSLTVATLPHCPADDVVFKLAEESGTVTTAGISPNGDRRALAMFNDETVFTSSGKGPAYSSGFGNEDEELNRAIEESLRQSSSAQASSAHASNQNHLLDPEFTSDSFQGFENDDPELAAAIAASLEMDTAQVVPNSSAQEDTLADKAASVSKRPRPAGGDSDDRKIVQRRISSGAEVEVDEDEEAEDAPPTAEQMRLARLARFGA